jgi:hypothetical protein
MGDAWTTWTTPYQSAPKYKNVDPLQNYKPQQGVVENAVFGQFGGGPTSVGNPYVGPNQWQTKAIDQLSGMRKEAEPAYGAGLKTTEKTLGGGYLDPMQQAGFKNVANDRRSIAEGVFGTGMASQAVNPALGSATRTAQQARAQQRVGTQADADIAKQAFTQYGAERGLQDAAMQRAVAHAPGLAQTLFGEGEALRSAEQDANTAAMMANLRAQGYDDASINQAIRYLGIASGKTIGPVVGKVPAEVMDQTAASLYKGFGCWVAAALYGAGTPAHRLARYWIMVAWRGPTADVVRALYRQIGPALARAITRWPALGRVIRPWFDRAVARGVAALRQEG